MRRFATLAAAGLLAASPLLAAEEPKPLSAGDPAPAFSLPGSDGKTHALADYVGKQAVVLAWFPKVFTGGCTLECKSLHESGEELRSFDVAYFAASVDPIEDVSKFAKSLDADYAMLADADGSVAKAYGVSHPEKGYPRRWTFYVGKDGKLLYVDREVKASTAGPDLAKKLAELGVPRREK